MLVNAQMYVCAFFMNSLKPRPKQGRPEAPSISAWTLDWLKFKFKRLAFSQGRRRPHFRSVCTY